MNVDEALRRMAEADELPREALQWALDHWDAASPRLIARLRGLANGDRSDETGAQAFYVAHLCGEKADARAYAPLCRMIAADPEIGDWLGEAVGATLPGILIQTFDGDVEPLTTAIQAAEADPDARASALAALAYLTRAKAAMSDDDMRAYLGKLMREVAPDVDSSFWFAWVSAIASLGYADMRAAVERLIAQGRLADFEYEIAEFDLQLGAARDSEDGLGGFVLDLIEPFDDAIGELEQLERNEEEFGLLDDEGDMEELGLLDDGVGPDEEPATPYLNPWRDVGRNDPCPCGSGKKFKKCCGA